MCKVFRLYTRLKADPFILRERIFVRPLPVANPYTSRGRIFKQSLKAEPLTLRGRMFVGLNSETVRPPRANGFSIKASESLVQEYEETYRKVFY